MKTTYLYLRVSTDEQKRKGFSLPEQEDRLLKYCEFNDIVIKEIYREDFSAKNFNRPEWKKLISVIKKDRGKIENNILFIKWDRFSRNIEYAYEMIGLLRKYNTTAMAIDQPIDFTVPESTVMLAVYLSIPEAENNRRALNTTDGIRRAKMLGRYPNKAPLGFINHTAFDGKKYIIPSQPEADIIKWSFKQLAKNCFKIEDVRKMACAKGLICSRSSFWKLIRNPVYCGFIVLSPKEQESELIKAVHEPLISESLFYKVQNAINTKKKVTCRTDELSTTFFLKGFLICPVCGRKLRGSFSQGRSKRYPYYHCSGDCKIRINAEILNDKYNAKLQQLRLSNNSTALFKLILEEVNLNGQKENYLRERKLLMKELEEQRLLLSRARKLFVASKLKFDDFKEIKKESLIISERLGRGLNSNNVQLRRLEKQSKMSDISLTDIFYSYSNFDVADKKQIVAMIPLTLIDIPTANISLKLNNALSKIILSKKSSETFEMIFSNDRITNFTYKKVSIKRAIAIMAKNDIQINEDEAAIITNFLYTVAKTYSFNNDKKSYNLKWISNRPNTCQTLSPVSFRPNNKRV